MPSPPEESLSTEGGHEPPSSEGHVPPVGSKGGDDDPEKGPPALAPLTPLVPLPLADHAMANLLGLGAQNKWDTPDEAIPADELNELLDRNGQLLVLGKLSSGGMGTVYLGYQTNLEREVAVKVVRNDFPDAKREAFAKRFKQETRALAKLSHPNIITIHDDGETKDGLLYLIMEYVDGVDVQTLIERHKRLKPEQAHAILCHVCDALQYAHLRQVIHRDIKPSNILVGYEGKVKVVDFGLAKMLDHNGKISMLTQSATVMGTEPYLAPEVLSKGMTNDKRVDIYALGVTLYHMLTGQIPRFSSNVASAVVPGLDARFDAVIRKAMQEDPALRYQSAEELREALDSIQVGALTQVPRAIASGIRSVPLPTDLRPQRDSKETEAGAEQVLPSSGARPWVFVGAGLGCLVALVVIVLGFSRSTVMTLVSEGTKQGVSDIGSALKAPPNNTGNKAFTGVTFSPQSPQSLQAGETVQVMLPIAADLLKNYEFKAEGLTAQGMPLSQVISGKKVLGEIAEEGYKLWLTAYQEARMEAVRLIKRPKRGYPGEEEAVVLPVQYQFISASPGTTKYTIDLLSEVPAGTQRENWEKVGDELHFSGASSDLKHTLLGPRVQDCTKNYELEIIVEATMLTDGACFGFRLPNQVGRSAEVGFIGRKLAPDMMSWAKFGGAQMQAAPTGERATYRLHWYKFPESGHCTLQVNAGPEHEVSIPLFLVPPVLPGTDVIRMMAYNGDITFHQVTVNVCSGSIQSDEIRWSEGHPR